MTAFFFQQPGSTQLLDAIHDAADGADEGAGTYAFASTAGIEAFFAVPPVVSMLRQRKPFHLVVGVDAITNAEALLCIEDKRARSRGALTAEAFLHEHPASTFHPKFAWFKKGGEVHLITGSGNLTARGLGIASGAPLARGNWEAFSIQKLNGAAALEVLENLDRWTVAQRLSRTLRSLDDEKVKARAIANGLIRYATGVPAAPAHPPAATPVDDETFEIHDILVRELPRNRPGQADVGKDALTEFFGFAGMPKNILLQHVSLDDQLGETEKIRLFTNASQNYRLELGAMAGRPYEIAADDSRIVLVATKLDRRSFRYTVIPVPAADHGELNALLGPIPHGRRLMRQKRVTGEALRAAWPNAPTKLLPVLTTTPAP